MKLLTSFLAVSAPLLFAAPALAQGNLSDADVEFFGEMLAMGDVCEQVEVTVRRDPLADWIAEQLITEADVDRVIAARDSKIDALQRSSQRIEDQRRVSRREELRNEYVADVLTRCNRLARSSRAGSFFSPRMGTEAVN